MNLDFLAIAIVFLISSSGVPLYAFITRRHFVRLRSYYAVQALFWLFLAVLSVLAMFVSVNTFSIVVNALLAIAGLVFGSYGLTMIFKDNGAYLLPFAKDNNKDAFMTYGASLDVESIKISTLNGVRMDVVHFVKVTPEQQQQIIQDVSNHPELVAPFGTKEAFRKLLRTFTFPFIIIAFAILMQFGM